MAVTPPVVIVHDCQQVFDGRFGQSVLRLACRLRGSGISRNRSGCACFDVTPLVGFPLVSVRIFTFVRGEAALHVTDDFAGVCISI